MIQAIQVLRFHLLELEKVRKNRFFQIKLKNSQVAHNFGIRKRH